LLAALAGEKFSEKDISVLIPHVDDPRNLSLTADVRHGALTGGIIGVIAAEFTTIGTLLLTGVGSFLVAGPLLLAIGGAAIGGAATGAAIGGLAAGTGDVARIVGIPDSAVAECEDDLRAGRGLVLVEADSDERLRTARALFVEAGANAIYDRPEAA
jgi:hypothetical protein